MKKAYTCGYWLFATRDLAIVSSNSNEAIELEVPEDTKLIGGKIHIDLDQTVFGEVYYQLSIELGNDFDYTNLYNYIPIVRCHSEREHANGINILDEDSLHTFGCNYQYSDLSLGLQGEIEGMANEHFKHTEYELDNYADFNED